MLLLQSDSETESKSSLILTGANFFILRGPAATPRRRSAHKRSSSRTFSKSNALMIGRFVGLLLPPAFS